MTLNDTKYQKNTNHFDKIGSHDLALNNGSENEEQKEANANWQPPYSLDYRNRSGTF